ncbi:hypothetical protein A6K76_08720 [Caryophanon latum]|uniref:Cell division protein DivIB n=1 Tax=Caryophanon latum TaxID=33977 RepID=A0A1C0YWB5_9BACL|nr:hypothetical protein A6K76_08720 [Caryophanon latum]
MVADKVIDLENRIPKLARRKKLRFIRQVSFIVLLVVLLVTILWYRQSEFSQIQSIELHGADYKSMQYHLNQLPIEVGESMWFDVEEVEQLAMNNRWLKSVKIEREWLTHVIVTIEEYAHVGYLQRDGSYYPILENGEIVGEPLKTFVMDAPLLTNFKDDAYLAELLKQLAQLDNEVHALISQINYTPSKSDNSVVTLYMTDGYEVRALIYEFADKLNHYPSIVKQLVDLDVKGIVDLEVGSYFTSYDSEYGIRIDESTYMEEALDESVEQNDASEDEDEKQDKDEKKEESPSSEDQSYGMITSNKFA